MAMQVACRGDSNSAAALWKLPGAVAEGNGTRIGELRRGFGTAASAAATAATQGGGVQVPGGRVCGVCGGGGPSDGLSGGVPIGEGFCGGVPMGAGGGARGCCCGGPGGPGVRPDNKDESSASCGVALDVGKTSSPGKTRPQPSSSKSRLAPSSATSS
mmetsp:Transcript_145/g.413  ORF Transcript_145/g.413 Transcript_145/m.413 type:complete len:158 (-) Transcript_145:685-1158(-)